MPDDPDIRLMDAEAEEIYSPERRRMGPDKKKIGLIVTVAVVGLAVLGGLYMMMGSGGISKEEARLIQVKLGSLEQKITVLEKQQAALQARLPVEGAEAALSGKIEALFQRVEALEKRPVPVAAEKPKAVQKEKAAAPSGKKVHTVQKGETVYGISKKYGISISELRKLNNLAEDQPLKSGQKLVVSK